MVLYECNRCKKLFNHKGNYNYHINKKNKCNETQNIVNYNYNIKNKDINTSINILKKINNKNMEIHKLQYENNILEKINKIKIKKNINSFGEELIDINDTILNRLFKNPLKGFIDFIEYVHFNVKIIENNNIRILSESSKYLEVFIESKWILKCKDEMIDILIKKNKKILDNYCNQNKKDLYKKYMIYSNNIDSYIFSRNACYKKDYIKLKNYIKILLLNLLRRNKIFE